MKVAFTLDVKTRVGIDTHEGEIQQVAGVTPTSYLKRVSLTVMSSDGVTAIQTPLLKSEARAIASALMGAAAEL